MMLLEVHSAPDLQIQELTGIIRADVFFNFFAGMFDAKLAWILMSILLLE